MSFYLIFPALLFLFLMSAIVKDIYSFTIPHWISGGILLLWGVAFIFHYPYLPSLKSSLSCFVVFFLVFGVIWLSGMFFGGGDWKLLSAISVWFGIESALELVLWISILGGVETIVIMILKKIDKQEKLKKYNFLAEIYRQKGVPYGVAISLGAIINYWFFIKVNKNY